MKANEVIDRKEFFSRVGIGIGAIVLTHCLSGCSASKDECTRSIDRGNDVGQSEF
jgi:hypothetical protein